MPLRRNIKKQFWFSAEEAADLKEKARKTCLTEAALVRLLIKGYEPKEKPDSRFYAAMQEVSGFTNKISEISSRAGLMDLREEIKRWHKFQMKIEHTFLRPERNDSKWQ